MARTSSDAGMPGRDDPARAREAARLEALSHLLDDAFRVPGTRLRFGLDGLLGLVPGVGDAATGALSAYLVLGAWRLGVPGGVLARMIANVAIDTVLGTIPVLGDLLDFGFKANRRNMALLRRHLDARRAG